MFWYNLLVGYITQQELSSMPEKKTECWSQRRRNSKQIYMAAESTFD